VKLQSSIKDALAESGEKLTSGVVDYVYMYPPRQAYRTLERDTSQPIAISLASRPKVNLYLHVPFCRQLCHFCNLYSTTQGPTVYEPYVKQLLAELETYRDDIENLEISTVYIGGGTPSLLEPRLIKTLVDAALNSSVHVRPESCEIALEVAPEHIDAKTLFALRDAGINRVNLGVQSTSASEVTSFGRRRSIREDIDRLSDAMEVGFRNVCADLIYGLAGQTNISWEASLNAVIGVRPTTICCYALTNRPYTGYAHQGGVNNSSSQILQRYDIAVKLLGQAGYKQETHVRWSIEGGGYLQKQYHWAMENVLGIGAGARSYLWDIDLRNGYSILDRKSVLNSYLAHDFKTRRFHREGFTMTDDERRRKFIVLGLGHLDLGRYYAYFKSTPKKDFPEIFDLLDRRKLIEISESRVSLTALGWRHRDPIAQLFFSETVRARLNEFTYLE
jgi:oxygen-independent coproporphyrinogen III oxidase